MPAEDMTLEEVIRHLRGVSDTLADWAEVIERQGSDEEYVEAEDAREGQALLNACADWLSAQHLFTESDLRRGLDELQSWAGSASDDEIEQAIWVARHGEAPRPS